MYWMYEAPVVSAASDLVNPPSTRSSHCVKYWKIRENQVGMHHLFACYKVDFGNLVSFDAMSELGIPCKVSNETIIYYSTSASSSRKIFCERLDCLAIALFSVKVSSCNRGCTKRDVIIAFSAIGTEMYVVEIVLYSWSC